MNRKHFLTSLLGTAALGSLAGRETSAPPPLPTAPASAPTLPPGEVKITDVRAYRFRKACFIKVETDAGVSGWGEADGSTKKMTPAYVDEYLKQHYVDRDPFASEGCWRDAYLRELEMGMSGLHPGSLAGIDNAVWDLKGKLLGVPVHRLLGGNGRDRIRVYGSNAGVDVVNLDVIKCGRITECKKAAAVVHVFGKQVMVHNAKPTLATAASLQLLASIPNVANYQEYAGRRLDQGYDELVPLFDNYFTFRDGFLEVPQTPGLGLSVNEEAMERLKKDD